MRSHSARGRCSNKTYSYSKYGRIEYITFEIHVYMLSNNGEEIIIKCKDYSNILMLFEVLSGHTLVPTSRLQISNMHMFNNKYDVLHGDNYQITSSIAQFFHMKQKSYITCTILPPKCLLCEKYGVMFYNDGVCKKWVHNADDMLICNDNNKMTICPGDWYEFGWENLRYWKKIVENISKKNKINIKKTYIYNCV